MQLAKSVQERDEVFRLDLGPFRRESEGGFDDVEDGYDLSRGLRHGCPDLVMVARYKRGRYWGFRETQSCVLEGSGENTRRRSCKEEQTSVCLAQLALGGIDMQTVVQSSRFRVFEWLGRKRRRGNSGGKRSSHREPGPPRAAAGAYTDKTGFEVGALGGSCSQPPHLQ